MNVIFLTHRLPYAPNRGDRNRAYHLMKEMSSFAKVSLFSLVTDDEEAAHKINVPFAHDVTIARVPRIRNFVRGAASLLGSRPLTHSLLNAPGIPAMLDQIVSERKPDVVVAFCSGMTQFALQSPLAGLPLVIDMVDVDSAKWQLLATKTRGPLRWVYRREARTLQVFEAHASQSASATLVVNERERETLARMAPTANVRVLQNGIDVDAFRPTTPPGVDPIVIFCGVMNYYPNEEGVLWFSSQVWPRIRAARPDARFLVVGSSPTRAIRQLERTDPSIHVEGSVPSVQPYLHKSAVSVAPLRLARGVQTKVIEALAAGLPVVITPVVSDGLPGEALPGCVKSAEDPADFARAVLGLLDLSPESRRQRAATARLDSLAWSQHTGVLKNILETAIEAGRDQVDADRKYKPVRGR